MPITSEILRARYLACLPLFSHSPMSQTDFLDTTKRFNCNSSVCGKVVIFWSVTSLWKTHEMFATCGKCQGRHNTLNEYRACSFAKGSSKSSQKLTTGLNKVLGNKKKSARPLLDQKLERENQRHQEAVKKRKSKSRLSSIPVPRTISPISIGGHTLTGYESAGVEERNRVLTTWSGKCSCGSWNKFFSDADALVANWRIHASESESSL